MHGKEAMSNDAVIKVLMNMKSQAMVLAYSNGLIADSEPWQKRWKKAETTSMKKKKGKKHVPKKHK